MGSRVADRMESRLRALGSRTRFTFPPEVIPESFGRAAVLIPFWRKGAQLRVVLTQRAPNLRTQGGMVSFPGGVLEDGETWAEAAIREAHEEVGLDPASVEVLGLLDDAWSGEPDLADALADAPQGVPVVLMAHEPDFADEWSVDKRVSLQLSGHSHGGQVRLPGLGIPMLPQHARRYPAGLYRVNGMWLYTTRGVGMVGPPVRFNCRPEITLFTLRAQ